MHNMSPGGLDCQSLTCSTVELSITPALRTPDIELYITCNIKAAPSPQTRTYVHTYTPSDKEFHYYADYLA